MVAFEKSAVNISKSTPFITYTAYSGMRVPVYCYYSYFICHPTILSIVVVAIQCNHFPFQPQRGRQRRTSNLLTLECERVRSMNNTSVS